MESGRQSMEERQAKVKEAMSHVKHKIAVMSGKGGVGKSTVAANLAVALSKSGSRIGLLDADIHGPSIPKILGIEDEKMGVTDQGMVPVLISPSLEVVSMGFLLSDRNTPVIWRGPMKMGALTQLLGEVAWGDLEYMIVDLPPGTGDEPLSIAQLIPQMDGSLIVTTPQEVALLSVRKCINFSKTLNIPVMGIIENMSGFICPYCKHRVDIFKTGGGRKAAEEFGVPFLGQIPLEPGIVDSGEEGVPFVTKAEPSSEAAKEFGRIVDAIEKQMAAS